MAEPGFTKQRPMVWAWILGMVCFAFELRSEEERPVRSSQPGWPQFRGPHRDGISDERGLLTQWPTNGPRQLWSITNLGRGYSSPVISGNTLVVTGDEGEHLVLVCFDLRGSIRWRATNGASWKDPYPGARSSATLSGQRVYHQNAHGRVVCLDASDGKELWHVDTFSTFESKSITWGHSECLLVDEKAVYVTVGGREALVVALDKTDGRVLWKSRPLKDSREEESYESTSYVSPIFTERDGRRMLIGCSLRHLFAVDVATGSMIWTAPMPTAYSVLASVPVMVGKDIFMTAPHGKGGALWKVNETGNGVNEQWRSTLDPCQGGIILSQGRLLGSYYNSRKGWAAVDAKSGQTLYEEDELYKGQAIFADERLYVLCEDGWMALLEPTSKEFVTHGKFRFAETRQRDAWAHPVILDRRLYLRFHERLAAYDIAPPTLRTPVPSRP